MVGSGLDAETMTARLLDLAEELGAPTAEVAEARAGNRNSADLLWRFLQRRPGWLLVFDNADDLATFKVKGIDAAGGAGWLRPSFAGLVVVTSRNSSSREWGQHAEVHQIGCLDAAAGAQVLIDLAPASGSWDDAIALSNRLHGLPLALHHAGLQLASYFAAEQTFGDYTQALDRRFARLMGGNPTDDPRELVTSTWEVSLDGLAAAGRPQARQLLRVLSCLAPAATIPREAVDLSILSRVCGNDLDMAADGMNALASVGLITVTAGPTETSPRTVMHPLVSETCRLRLDAEDCTEIGGIAVALLSAATSQLSVEEAVDYPAWVQFLPHLNSIYSYLGPTLAEADLASLANITAYAAAALLWAGLWPVSADLAQCGLQYGTRLGVHHEAVLALRFHLASVHRFNGMYAEAEREYSAVLEDMVQVLGHDHPSTLAARYEIARLLADRAQYQGAEREYRQVLAAMERLQGPDHPDTLTTRIQIAQMLWLRGQYEQAEQEYRDVLTTSQRALGPDHPGTLAARHQIAQVFWFRGQYETAEQHYRELLTSEMRILGPDHPTTLETRHLLAAIFSELGQNEQAIREYQDVLAARQRILGPDHPDTLSSQGSLAALQNPGLPT